LKRPGTNHDPYQNSENVNPITLTLYTLSTACPKSRWRRAVPRLGKLVSRGWLTETKAGAGKATEWSLAPGGVAVVKPDREDL
jgi:hypothetical protein